MKRQGNLYSQIVSFENLILAAKKAQKGKRFRANVLAFNHNLESELLQIQKELIDYSYISGEYRTFRITDPKPRLISAAPYRDRVIHHALCNIIAPILDRALIFDTYANQIGKGTHRALHRFTTFARSSQYVLQCDIQKFFPSIDLEILKERLRQRIKCQDTLWLIDTIIDASNEQESVFAYFLGDDLLSPCQHRKGLPIGNLTSQLFANFYLAGLDRFVKEFLGCGKYLRYVDDFALFSNDRFYLKDARQQIENHLSQLRLKIHPIKSQLFATHIGANFVGFRVLSDRIRICSKSVRRARHRLRSLKTGCDFGEVEPSALERSLQSWQAHLQYGDTHQLAQTFKHEDISYNLDNAIASIKERSPAAMNTPARFAKR
jgi:retron-type reverse transcriptase